MKEMLKNIDNRNDDYVCENISNLISGRNQSNVRPKLSISLIINILLVKFRFRGIQCSFRCIDNILPHSVE